jgi:glycosyltransferase involved in cell wall biosynthesis
MKSRDALRKINLSTKQFDVLWLESEYVLPIVNHPDIRFNKSFLRIHNLESKYFVSLATSSIPHPSSLFYFLEAVKFRRFDNRFPVSIDKRLFISSSEMKAAAGMDNKFYLPPVYPDFNVHTDLQKRDGKRVLFVGSLFMPNNRKSIDFYIQQVHPLLLTQPDYEFVVIGSTRMDAALQQKLKTTYAGAANVRFLFDASEETILKYYSSSRVFVNPVFETAGIKMKVLDAIRHGIPVVSTKAGIEGTGLDAGQDVLVADSAKEMANQLKAIFSGTLDDFSLVRNAQLKLQSNQTKLKQVFYE